MKNRGAVRGMALGLLLAATTTACGDAATAPRDELRDVRAGASGDVLAAPNAAGDVLVPSDVERPEPVTMRYTGGAVPRPGAEKVTRALEPCDDPALPCGRAVRARGG